MTARIAILIAIDIFFVAGLAVLVYWGGSSQIWAILGCIALIGYITYSIMQLRAKTPAA